VPVGRRVLEHQRSISNDCCRHLAAFIVDGVTRRTACDGMTAAIWNAVGSRCLLAASSPPQSLETLAVRFCSRESAYEPNTGGIIMPLTMVNRTCLLSFNTGNNWQSSVFTLCAISSFEGWSSS
jgi:hypothetical protein